MRREVYWIGDAPERCQIYPERKITDQFVDGATGMGPWALMHPETHKRVGMGLGLGRGQLYEKQPDGRWKKTAG